MVQKSSVQTDYRVDPRIIEKWDSEFSFPLQDSLVAVCQVGSHSHNTYIPLSDPNGIDDIDYIFIIQPPFSNQVSLFPTFETKTIMVDELDVTIHTLKKFCGLVLKQNPSVLNLLYLEEPFYHYQSLEFVQLLDARSLWLSKRIAKTFIGFANAQLYKMEHQSFEGYMGAKRKSLVERYGYDTKNAAHALRLLNTGIDALRFNTIRVFRPDSETNYYKAIKSGQVDITEVKEKASELLKLAQVAEAISTLKEDITKQDIASMQYFYQQVCRIRWQLT